MIKFEVLYMAYFLHERTSVTRERIRNSVNRVDQMGRQKGKIKILEIFMVTVLGQSAATIHGTSP